MIITVAPIHGVTASPTVHFVANQAADDRVVAAGAIVEKRNAQI